MTIIKHGKNREVNIMMSGETELRLINAVTRLKPFMKAKDLEYRLEIANKVIRSRKSSLLDIELDSSLRLSQIIECKKILKELEDK